MIQGPALREAIVGAYSAIESRETCWPRVDDSYCVAVLRRLPFDFVHNVVEDCVVVEGTREPSEALRDCGTTPSEATAESWRAR